MRLIALLVICGLAAAQAQEPDTKPTFEAWLEAARKEVRRVAAERYRACLERVQGWVANASPYWFGDRVSVHDAYAFTLLRWGGFAGIDPASLPAYRAYIDRVMQAGPVAAVNPTRRARGTGGNPRSIPITSVISATAKAGNQPECIAARPTMIS